MDGQRVERKWGERREVLRRAPGFLACAVEPDNARGSGVWGELELSCELIECETYQRML